MFNGKQFRIVMTGSIVALATAAPVAQATQSGTSMSVCNQATHTSLGGDMVATDGVSSSSAKFTSGLKAKPGQGAGLATAAQRSPALSACSAPVEQDSPGTGWGAN